MGSQGHYYPKVNGSLLSTLFIYKHMMNGLLFSFGLSQNLWGESILTYNYLLNKLPIKKLKKTPYEL